MNKNFAYGGICALMLAIGGSALAKDNDPTKSQQDQNVPNQSGQMEPKAQQTAPT